MKFSNIIFLCLLVLFALISCSDAGKKNKGVGRKGGKGKGKNNGGVRKFKGGKKGGRKTRKNNKNDDDDDEEDNKKSKRKGGKKNKSAKKTRKAGKKGKKFGKKTRGSDAKTLKKGGKGKKKSKGCRHPDGADRINGNILTAKVSGAVPCYKIECQGSGKKFKWMYMEQKCKTCTFGNIQYMVGYASEQKCYGTDGKECYIMMCMEDGQFRRQGWPCEDHSFFGTTTPSSGTSTTKRVYFKSTWNGKTWKSNYADTSSSDFKSMDSTIQSAIKSSGLNNYKKSKVTKMYAASATTRANDKLGTKGYIECEGTGTHCSDSEVNSALSKAGASGISLSSSSLTTTSVATTTA